MQERFSIPDHAAWTVFDGWAFDCIEGIVSPRWPSASIRIFVFEPDD